MLTLLISLLAAFLVGVVSYRGLPPSAVIVMTTLVFLICHLAISLVLRMQSKKINAKLQAMMLEIQQKLMGMQNRMMHRPMGSPKQMMQMLEREQNAGLERMIAALDMYKPLYIL